MRRTVTIEDLRPMRSRHQSAAGSIEGDFCHHSIPQPTEVTAAHSFSPATAY